MKRLIVLGIVVFLCLPLFVYAASIGGVETQGQGKFSISFDQGFVFDRDMKENIQEGEIYSHSDTFIIDSTVINTSGTVSDQRLKSELDRMSRSMIRLNYGVTDNLDVFVRLGEANFKWKAKGKASDNGTFTDSSGNSGTYEGVLESRGTFKGKSAFVWGVGMKGVYPLENDWFLGMQVQYLRHKNTLKCKWAQKERVTYEVTSGPDTGETGTYETSEWEDSWKAKATVQEWQISPYIAKKLGNFIPYFGVKYSDCRIKYKDEEEKLKFKADDNFGVFLGTDYRINDAWSVNFEVRFIDETAISFGGTYRF